MRSLYKKNMLKIKTLNLTQVGVKDTLQGHNWFTDSMYQRKVFKAYLH